MLEFRPTCPICDTPLRAARTLPAALAEVSTHLDDAHGITLVRIVQALDHRAYADPPASPNWPAYREQGRAQ